MKDTLKRQTKMQCNCNVFCIGSYTVPIRRYELKTSLLLRQKESQGYCDSVQDVKVMTL